MVRVEMKKRSTSEMFGFEPREVAKAERQMGYSANDGRIAKCNRFREQYRSTRWEDVCDTEDKSTSVRTPLNGSRRDERKGRERDHHSHSERERDSLTLAERISSDLT